MAVTGSSLAESAMHTAAPAMAVDCSHGHGSGHGYYRKRGSRAALFLLKDQNGHGIMRCIPTSSGNGNEMPSLLVHGIDLIFHVRTIAGAAYGFVFRIR